MKDMGISTPMMANHDDNMHTGSAKRGVANGLGSLDALGHTTPAEMILAELLANKNAAAGYAGLDASSLLALAQQRLNFKLLSFTRDSSIATGTQAVTGAGFVPRGVIFISNTINTPEASIGFDDGTNHFCIFNGHGITANTWSNGAASSLFLATSATINYIGAIQSVDADGFTIYWTKGGAKTGTVSVYAIAFR